MSKYFIYCRKSTESEDRQILSLESQTNELRQLAEKEGCIVLETFTEARSAKAPGRPIFNEVMQRIYRGEAQGIICWKLDRLARNPVDGGAIIWAIKQHGLRIVTSTQSYSREEDNTILMYIEFGMAQKYIDDLSRNVKRGLKAKLEKGWFPSVAPPGYLNNRLKEQGERDIQNDPERFTLIRRMWDMMLTGLYTPPQILRIANRDWSFRTRQAKRLGDKPLARSRLYWIFSNPFYCGRFEYPKGSGQWYNGKHKPMVTEEEYNRVQVLLGRRGNPRAITRAFPFTGMICCGECDSRVTAEEKHQLICSTCRHKFAYLKKVKCPQCKNPIEEMSNPTLLHYTYYHCTKTKNPQCSQRSIGAKDLDRQIETYLSRIEISERFKEWAVKRLRDIHEQEVSARNDIVQYQQRAYQDCLKQLDNLVRLKTSPENGNGSLLSDEEYGKQRFQLLKEKSRIEELFQDTGDRVEKWLGLAEKTFEFACRARGWFAEGDIKTKKEILSTIGSNLTLKDKKLSIEARNPLVILEKSLPGIKEDLSPIEPKDTRINKRKRGLGSSLSPSACQEQDDVRTYTVFGTSIVQKIYTFFKECDSVGGFYMYGKD